MVEYVSEAIQAIIIVSTITGQDRLSVDNQLLDLEACAFTIIDTKKMPGDVLSHVFIIKIFFKIRITKDLMPRETHKEADSRG